jgi:DNA-binding GntR family transcriptional regulator
MTMAPTLGKLRFNGMRIQVADTLRKAIFEGTFKPGNLLQDTVLAEQLSVSRGPVREALLQLEKESLVRNIHNRGWFVIELSSEEVSEIISLRCPLEAIGLKQAAAHVTPAELRHLAAIHAELRRKVRAGDAVAVLSQDFEFHRYLWHLAGHQLLEQTLNKISTPYFAYMQTVIRSLSLPLKEYQSTLKTHQLMLDYVAGQTQLTAEECIAAHMAPLKIKDWERLMRTQKNSKRPKRA